MKQKRNSKKRAVKERVETESKERKVYTDLDFLFGTWSEAEAEEFDRILQEQRQIDEELWR